MVPLHGAPQSPIPAPLASASADCSPAPAELATLSTAYFAYPAFSAEIE
jgi:hypothetical protein